MTGTERKPACTVRVTGKFRPDEYDELFRHVCEVGSTMSAVFPRERDKGDERETSASADAPECRYSQQPSAELGLAVIKEYGTGDGITQGRMISWPYSRNLRAVGLYDRAVVGDLGVKLHSVTVDRRAAPPGIEQFQRR